jgi:hypothetical protein
VVLDIGDNLVLTVLGVTALWLLAVIVRRFGR